MLRGLSPFQPLHFTLSRKNTALSCGVFTVYLFYQHILAEKVGFEPT